MRHGHGRLPHELVYQEDGMGRAGGEEVEELAAVEGVVPAVGVVVEGKGSAEVHCVYSGWVYFSGPNRMTLAAQLLANRPHLAAGTVKTYVSILSSLAKQTKLTLATPMDVITHHRALLDHMAHQPPMSRKSRLAALIVFIDQAPHSEEAVKAIRDKMVEDIKTCEAEDDTGEKNAKQEAAMIPWEDVLAKYETIKAEAEPLLMGTSTLTRKEFQQVQLYVLLSCYLLIPPRRSLDYTEFKLRNPTATSNHMEVTGRKASFVFNQYKTQRKYGQQVVAIPPTLQKIIQAWAKHNPHEWLLMNVSQQGRVTPTALAKLLNAAFAPHKISSSMLRHIYLSSIYAAVPAMKEMKERAAAMGQSVTVALGKYVKH